MGLTSGMPLLAACQGRYLCVSCERKDIKNKLWEYMISRFSSVSVFLSVTNWNFGERTKSFQVTNEFDVVNLMVRTTEMMVRER